MRNIQVETINGITTEKVYNVNDFPYFDLQFIPTCRKGRRTTYYNASSAYDIETTTQYKKNAKGEVTWQRAFMYHWQYCINNSVVFGRTWEEFQYFLGQVQKYMHLTNSNRLVTYVHNLAYEFQFTKDFVDIDELFAKDKRKPMKLTSNGIEFRCSYFLSNMSLSKFCENYGASHYKLTDTYDYDILRTPTTTLTESEEAYCYNDVRGLCECVDKLLESDNIATLPLTNTGFVRREFRTAMNSNKKNRSQFEKIRLSPSEYSMLMKAFRGGNTHASRFFANQIIHNVESYDIQSSYPACMMLDDFPIGKFMAVTLDTQEKLDYYTSNYCTVMTVEFFNIRIKPKNPIPYVDIAHCEKKSNIINDNGRVLTADYIQMTLTNIDLDIIRETYDYDGLNVTEAIYAEKGKLPLEFMAKLIEFYEKKTKLKGIPESEYEYNRSKNQINSSYGMMVSALVHDEISYIENEWETYKADIANGLDHFYNSRNNFLSYQWGVFVCANARRRLQDMLNIVAIDVIYTDTDSIKFINSIHIAEFEQKNAELITDALQSVIPAYAEKDDVRYYLGIWDKDAHYERFKTLGAKKYAYEKYNKLNELIFEITVSGMGKKLGAKAVGCIENFEIGSRYSNIGRTTSWYNESEITKIKVGSDIFTTASNIGIVESTYKLGVTLEYWEVLEKHQNLA